MKLSKIFLPLGIGLFLSSGVGLFLLWLLDFRTKFLFAVAIALINFIIYSEFILPKYVINVKFDMCKLATIQKHLLEFTYAFSFISVLAVPSINDTIYITCIPPVNIFRFIGASLLITFLPGFIILKIIIKGKLRISKIETLIFSYLLSFFLVPLIGFILITTGRSIKDYGPTAIFILNFFLFSLYMLTLKRKGIDDQHKTYKVTNSTNINLIDLAFFTLLSSLILVFIYGTYGCKIFGDQRDYYNEAILFYKGLFPAVKNDVIPPQPWWFHIYVAFFFALSGLPSINTYNLLNILNILQIFSFYLMAITFLEDKKSAKIATLLSFFSGFGWIYTAYLKMIGVNFTDALYISSIKTYDIFLPLTHFISSHPDLTSPLHLIALPSMFTLTSLLIKIKNDPNIDTNATYFLITILTSLGTFGHPEFSFFIIIVAIAILVYIPETKIKNVTLSTIAGLILVMVIDSLAPGRYYTGERRILQLASLKVPIIVAGVLLVIFCYFLAIVHFKIRKRRIIMQIPFNSIGVHSSLHLIIPSFLLYLYLFSFIVWNEIRDTFSVWSTLGFAYFTGSTYLVLRLVPWYFYPIRLGILGILTIFGLYYFNKQYFEKFFIAIMWISIAILIRFPMLFEEYRLTKLIIYPLSILSAWVISRTFSRIKIIFQENGLSLKNNIVRCSIAGLLLSSIIIAGISSTLLYINESVYITQNPYTPLSFLLTRRSLASEEKMEAYYFLQSRINPSTETVISLPGEVPILEEEWPELSGLWDARVQLFPDLMELTQPENAFKALREIGGKYIYLTTSDLRTLETSSKYKNSFLGYLLTYLNITFKNSETIIYEIPSFCPPDEKASFAVMIPNNLRNGCTNRYMGRRLGYLLPVTLIALSKVSYNTILEEEHSLFNYSTILLTSDINNVMIANRYLQWVKNGGKLVILNSYPVDLQVNHLNLTRFGYFDDIFEKWNPINLSFKVEQGIAVLKKECKVDSYIYTNNVFINTDKYPYLIIRAKVSDPNMMFRIAFKDINGIFHDEIIVDPVGDTEWHTYIVFLKDWGTLTELHLYCETGTASIFPQYTFIDYIAFSDTLPDVGSTGFFYDLIMNDSNVNTIDHFTNISFVKKIGNGEIIFINIYPYYQKMFNGEQKLNLTFLKSFWDYLLKNLELKSCNYHEVTEIIPLNYAKSINVAGQITIKSQMLYICAPVHAEFLKILPRGGNSELFFRNVTIKEFKAHGETVSRLTLDTLKTGQELFVLYKSVSYPQMVISDDSQLELEGLDGTEFHITLIDENREEHDMMIQCGRIFLCASFYVLNFRMPFVTIDGLVLLRGAYISSQDSPANRWVNGGQVLVKGETSFAVSYVDNSIIRLGEFVTSGEKFYPEKEPLWNEWNVQWLKILISPYHLFLLIAMGLTLYLKSRHFNKIEDVHWD